VIAVRLRIEGRRAKDKGQGTRTRCKRQERTGTLGARRCRASIGRFQRYTRNRAAYDAYLARGVVRTLNARDPEWGGDEPWREPHYYAVGEDALRIVIEALAMSGRELPRRVLDFSCGSGRVTRHLRAFLPDADIWASNVDPVHVRFCAEHFGTHAHQSSTDLSTVRLDAEFDLIFCGSLLTHLPEAQSRAALSLIARALGPEGIAASHCTGATLSTPSTTRGNT
jgi:SAM-dependent methyltransferase